MPNKDHSTFSDVQEIFDRALTSPHGVRSKQLTRSHAINLRARFNYFRTLDRRENAKIYQGDDPRRYRSIYDELVLEIPPKGSPDDTTLYIRRRNPDGLNFEEIKPPKK